MRSLAALSAGHDGSVVEIVCKLKAWAMRSALVDVNETFVAELFVGFIWTSCSDRTHTHTRTSSFQWLKT